MKSIKSFFLLLFTGINLIAQNQLNPKMEKAISKNTTRGFYICGGASYSSVNIHRNYSQNPYKFGWNARVCWELAGSMRITGEYTSMPLFQVTPTWLNVKNRVVELNVNYLARIKDQKALFYTISGIYYQSWNGFYTGQEDFTLAKNVFTPQQQYTNKYLGVNLGLGIERAFRYVQVFAEFKYRFSETDADKVFGITDALYNAGVKIKLPSLNSIGESLVKKYKWF